MIYDKAHVLARLEAEAKAIYAHARDCSACPDWDTFGVIIPPLGACHEGRRLWRLHRRATVDLSLCRWG